VRKKLFSNDQERGRLLLDIAALLEEGYNIGEAIELYSAFLTGARQEWLHTAYKEMEKGDMFAEQLLEAGFSAEIINFIRMLEMHGAFQKALEQAGYMLIKRYELKKQVHSVLHYPLVLLSGVFLLGVVLMEGILPQFQQFFQAMDHELPILTRGMLLFMEWFRLPLFLSAVGAGLLLFFWLKRKPAAEQVEVMLRIPIIHKYIRQLISYYFAAQLAPMLKGGLSLQQALKTMKEESKLIFFQYEADYFIHHLEEGTSFSDIIKGRAYYIPQLSVVWAFGETRGESAQELETFASYLFQKMYENTNKAIGFFQPVIFCFIGAIVILLFLSMMLPVFSVIDSFS
jgi:competence protein ComGB